MPLRATIKQETALRERVEQAGINLANSVFHQDRPQSSPQYEHVTWRREKELAVFGLAKVLVDLASWDLRMELWVGWEPVALFSPPDARSDGSHLPCPSFALEEGEILVINDVLHATDPDGDNETLYYGDNDSQRYVSLEGLGRSLAFSLDNQELDITTFYSGHLKVCRTY